MQDSDLKKLLLETCPVLPGQEARAWAVLRNRLAQPKLSAQAGARAGESGWAWIYLFSWRGLGIAASLTVGLFVAGQFFGIGVRPLSLATANSQAPGIYATSFYSNSAKAQVVWLNGMEPATDKPTYLDPTTSTQNGNTSATVGDPNSL